MKLPKTLVANSNSILFPTNFHYINLATIQPYQKANTKAKHGLFKRKNHFKIKNKEEGVFPI